VTWSGIDPRRAATAATAPRNFTSLPDSTDGGGGGGGGWFGGGGGAGGVNDEGGVEDGSGGGGGSGFGPDGTKYERGGNDGDGEVSISYDPVADACGAEAIEVEPKFTG
jgi:hypothetical protein